jgi:hypothetical protein
MTVTNDLLELDMWNINVPTHYEWNIACMMKITNKATVQKLEVISDIFNVEYVLQ